MRLPAPSRLTDAALDAIKRGWFTTPGRWDLLMKDRLSSSPVYTAGNQYGHTVLWNLIRNILCCCVIFADHFDFDVPGIKRKRTPEKKSVSSSPFLSTHLLPCLPLLVSDVWMVSQHMDILCKYYFAGAKSHWALHLWFVISAHTLNNVWQNNLNSGSTY